MNSSFVKRHERDLIEIFTTFQLIFDCSNNNAVVVVWLPFLQHIHHSPKKAAGWLVVVVVEYECLAHESATIIANAAAPKETIASVWWRAWPLVQQQPVAAVIVQLSIITGWRKEGVWAASPMRHTKRIVQ